jgi:DsbC/DsbD-like thiol-disulfide interchange protein/cytochrome c biogenesis protein CcdA
MRALALLLCLIPCLAFGATSNLATTKRDTVALISQTNTPQNGAINLALKFHLAPGWHIYWQNPGDAGLAPQLTLATGIAGPFAYPAPPPHQQGPGAAYVLSGDVLLPFAATHLTGNTIEADAQWLICSDICIPEHAHFTLLLTGGPSAQAAAFPATPAIIPSPFPATIAPDGTLTLTGPTAATIATAHFFPESNGEIINRAPQSLTFTPAGLALKLPTTPGFTAKTPLPGIIELTDKSGVAESLALTPKPGAIATQVATPLIAILILAFLGGLTLNLMPCVFPILAMKALSIIRLGGHAAPKIRAESFAYTAGILTAMLLLSLTLLGLREAGIEAGWGFQFQSPIFVALIAWLIFCAGLSLAGVFEITGLTNLGARLAERHSFFTGLLAVVVATPCTAPFMGAAIAAALAAPPITALAIFLTLGLGLAAPFLLLAIIPGFAQILPRPGGWMILLQRALTIPMFATFAWLVWVEKFQTGFLGVALLVLGAAALALAAAKPRLRPLALASLLILPFLRPAAGPTLTLPNAEPFTPTRLATLQSAKSPVLVDMTAAWCVTCLVNDRTTLQSPQVQAALKSHHVQILVGDWTNRDPDITAYLAQNHRAGVPLYVYISPTGAAQTLPQILTPGIVEEAVN